MSIYRCILILTSHSHPTSTHSHPPQDFWQEVMPGPAIPFSASLLLLLRLKSFSCCQGWAAITAFNGARCHLRRSWLWELTQPKWSAPTQWWNFQWFKIFQDGQKKNSSFFTKEEDLLNTQSLHCYILKELPNRRRRNYVTTESLENTRASWNNAPSAYRNCKKKRENNSGVTHTSPKRQHILQWYNLHNAADDFLPIFVSCHVFIVFNSQSKSKWRKKKRGPTMGLGWTNSRGVGSTLFGSLLSGPPRPCLTVRCFNWCSSQTHRPEKAPTTPTHAQRQPAAGAAKGRKSCASSRLRGRVAHCACDRRLAKSCYNSSHTTSCTTWRDTENKNV